ncbi:CatB-related O-acetyltransferase [Limnoraphis robusta Tam1]|uniref:CatB-related O-acetyltransferase n=1 Tax=Limnoraphis robusta TaxID=1118279 RepID=UPI002B1EB495|nr:CatB-related O-acetyltransferase [Limnoraphis robusta]MEA5501206.1 CatB-related O-acetyltransferase [Limnoraphis robusta BA-68 BA1]MEA5542778.1 CatB-related O-acetyltransferase [Limnoraphis robusta Tam1]
MALWKPEDQIKIGKFCSFAKNITIFGGGEHLMERVTTYPFVLFFTEPRLDELIDGRNKGVTTIENDVWIGYEATILSGVKIGNGAVIGAKSVVAQDIPDYAIAVGNPARVKRYRFQPETIERLLALKWWNWDLKKILANLDKLYQNPDHWADDLQFIEPDADSPTVLSHQQVINFGLCKPQQL